MSKQTEKELNTSDTKYKINFIRTIIDNANIKKGDEWIAMAEYESYRESVGEDYVGDPVEDAKESIAHWE